MVQRDEGKLFAYLAKNLSEARLVLRDTPGADEALRALRHAAMAVWSIPHPDEPAAGLPKLCSPSIQEDLPVLELSVRDRSDYAGRVLHAILEALDADGVVGRLEPWPYPGFPFDSDPRAGVFADVEHLSELDERGLPPAFPAGLPVPQGWTLVMAARGRTGGWQHAGWRRHARQAPFAEYLQLLRSFGLVLQRHPGEHDAEENGMHGYTFDHPAGTGAVWLHHEGLQRARKRGRCEPGTWYVTVVWKPADKADPTPPPLPVWLSYDFDDDGDEDQVALAFGVDERGRLHEQDLRALFGPLLEPGPLVRYETGIALEHAKDVLAVLADELPRRFPGDEWLNPLLRLRGHRTGVPLDELLAKLADTFGPEDPAPFLDEMERCGRLARSAGGHPPAVRLTQLGHEAMDERMRRLAELQAALLDGIGAEQLAIVRHACLQLFSEPDTPELAQENGLFFRPDWREFIGPLAPHQILCLEALGALSSAARSVSLPRRFRPDGQLQTVLWLHQRPDAGLTAEEVVAGLDVEAPDTWLEAGERAGALTRSPGPDGDVVRLTDRGHQRADGYLRALSAELAKRYDGVDLDHLEQVRDASWRLVRARGTG